MKDAIVQYYECRYHEDHPLGPFRDWISYNFVNIEDALDLGRHFLEEEVWSAINNLGKERAPA